MDFFWTEHLSFVLPFYKCHRCDFWKWVCHQILLYSTYPIFIYLNKLSEDHWFCEIKTIVKNPYISLLDMIKIIFVAKSNKKKFSLWNTQKSNNSCKNKLLLCDGLSLLINKLCFNFSKYLLDSLPLWLVYLFLTEIPWCFETLTLKCLWKVLPM